MRVLQSGGGGFASMPAYVNQRKTLTSIVFFAGKYFLHKPNYPLSQRPSRHMWQLSIPLQWITNLISQMDSETASLHVSTIHHIHICMCGQFRNQPILLRAFVIIPKLEYVATGIRNSFGWPRERERGGGGDEEYFWRTVNRNADRNGNRAPAANCSQTMAM